MATSMKYYAGSDLNELLPIWHGNCFSYVPDAAKLYQTDHGEVGVDLMQLEGTSSLTVRFAKQLDQHVRWKHSSIRPYRTVKRVSNIAVQNFEKLQARSPSSKHSCSKRRQNSEEEYFCYQGNCLSSCIAPGGTENILLSVIGLHLSQVGIESVSGALKSERSNPNKSTLVKESSRNTRILQTGCHTIHDKVLCSIRRRYSAHVLSASEDGKKWKLTELDATKINDSYVTDLRLSPFIESEMLYTTDKGYAVLRDYDARDDEVIKVPDCEDQHGVTWLECAFGAHPRCILCKTRQAIHLYDMRDPDTASSCLLQLPCVMIPSEEQICCSVRDPTNNFLQYVATTRTLLSLDERFLKHAVLKWSHLLSEPPTLCDAVMLPCQCEKAVVLGNISTQSTALINVNDEGNNLRNFHSKGAVKHFPQVRDILEHSLSCSQEEVSSRLLAPLIGLCVLPVVKENEDPVQLLQMTLAGDIFAHTARSSIKEAAEDNDPEEAAEDFVDGRKDWADWAARVFRHSGNNLHKKTNAPSTAVDAYSLFQELAVEREHLCLCVFCCNCQNHARDTPSSNTDHCMACGNHVDRSQQLLSAFKKGSSMAGNLEGEVDLTALGVLPVDTSLSSDKRTMMILQAWNDEDTDMIGSETNSSVLDALGSQCSLPENDSTSLLPEIELIDKPNKFQNFPSDLCISQGLSQGSSQHDDEELVPSNQQESQMSSSAKLLKSSWRREVTLGF